MSRKKNATRSGKKNQMKKTVRRIALLTFLISLIPFRFRKDEETGGMEIRSLLWAWRKTPRREGETKDHYAFSIPPSGLDHLDAREAGAPAEETAAEE